MQKGIELLEQMDIKNLLVRKFLLDYLQRADNHQKICEVFINPQTIYEAVAVIEGCVKLKDKTILTTVLDSDFVKSSNDASLQAIIMDAKFRVN